MHLLSLAKEVERIKKRVFLNLIILPVLCATITLGQQVDTDGDGLSDFQEIHKYRTNPTKADTDDDGIPDGDWNERREYTYSVRSILRFMHPFDEDALNDNFQDAMVLAQEDYYVEMEVIHYPFGTAEDSISANPNWQQDYADMTEYLAPGITTNWDDQMRQDLLAELQGDGIVVDNLTDKQVVEQVSSWVVSKYTPLDVFTTYYIYYPNGQPEIYPGLEDAYEEEFYSHGYEIDWPIEEHFEHELLGKGMYYNKTRGTCTSTAIALTTVLRAIGIPTRMIIVIPIVDASNPSQSQLVEQGISNNQVRQVVLDWLSGAGTGFTAHTFNEVYVGNEWHRLNYSKLGQPILDEHCFGLHTHLYTFNDLSEANLAPTWGWRYGKGIRNDVFQYSNPYTTISLSDLLGGNAIKPAATLYVDDDSPGDPAPGNPAISDPCEDGSLLHPCDCVQEAINAAKDGNTIIVHQGTYTGFGNRDIDFKGLAITVRSTDPNNPEVVAATIIDCQGSEFEPHRGFYFRNSEDSDSILDGLTVINGYTSGNWPDECGGGIFCYKAAPTIKNCVITGNKSSKRGGGLWAYQSNPTVVNCTFHNNNSGVWGGASYAWGGAVYSQSSSISFVQCTFSKNLATTYGGGISAYDSEATFTNCTFHCNQASLGGAMRIYNCTSTLKNCILWNDIPNELYIGGTSPTITFCNIQGGWAGTGNINADPRFADPDNGDYHLKSQAGHWKFSLYIRLDPTNDGFINLPDFAAFAGSWKKQGSSIPADLDDNGIADLTDLKLLLDNYLASYLPGDWVLDDVNSPCIDAGNPNSDWTAELWPHGKRINMGAYGGTPQASMSLSSMGNIADLNNTDLVDYADLMAFANKWLCRKILLPEDLNRDGIVNFIDFTILANNWLWEQASYPLGQTVAATN